MMTITEAINEYLLEQTVRGNSPKTVKDYKTKLMMFYRFIGDVDVRRCSLAPSVCLFSV